MKKYKKVKFSEGERKLLAEQVAKFFAHGKFIVIADSDDVMVGDDDYDGDDDDDDDGYDDDGNPSGRPLFIPLHAVKYISVYSNCMDILTVDDHVHSIWAGLFKIDRDSNYNIIITVNKALAERRARSNA